MNQSIRLRLIDWLEGIRDHVPQYLVKVLRRREVHPQPGSNLRDRLVVGIQNNRAEGKGDDSEVLASLHQQINVMNGAAIVPNFEIFFSERELSAAPNHDLICHQPSPIGTIFDVASVNARAFGVERAAR